MTEIKYMGFEQGPIRPPSEAESLLVRITRNCPWNRCTFCPVYKEKKFSRRPVEHVLQDIDTIRNYVDAIIEHRKHSKAGMLKGEELDDELAFYAAYNFIAGGMKSVFLQDGNSLIIKPSDLIIILKHLRTTFPTIERITSYARSSTIARIDDVDLEQIHQAGLNRIHIGMESGSDEVLAFVQKGADKATQVLAGQKVKRAGIQLSEYFIPGLGGVSLTKENALESADALNQINPDYIRLRTLALPEGAPITQQSRDGKFEKMGEVQTAEELLLFLESLEGITSYVRSDHVLNLFSEVNGKLPEDKNIIIEPVKKFLALDAHDQMVFCLGRRTHCMGKVDDLENPTLRGYAEQACKEYNADLENYDQIVNEIIKKFI